MNKNFYAILLGFNTFADQTYLPGLEYAEKDARDLYDALTDPDCGGFPKENIHIITGNVSKEDAETELYVHAVHERGPDDTVLIYYSGHGFIAGDSPESYLATPDTNVLKILKNPNAGLQMEYLRKKIFLAQPEKRAKNMILFLDCCYSGSFCPELKGGYDSKPRALVETHDFDGDGRVAFVSSPAGVVSRESKELQNGVFTAYLIRGLRGEAVEKHNENENRSDRRDVTISSLISYVQAMCPKTQPPVSYGKSTRIVLTQPKVRIVGTEDNDKSREEIISRLPDSLPGHRLRANPLSNPIEKQIEYIEELTRYLSEIPLSSSVILGNKVLNAVKNSLSADFCFVFQLDDARNIKLKFLSNSAATDIDAEEYADFITRMVLPLLIREKAKLLPTRFGFCVESKDTKGVTGKLIIVPLRLEYPREFLVINGITDRALEYGELLGHSLLSLYRATFEFSSLDVTRIENVLLDEVKRNFGHVPHKIYLRRFGNFKKHLHKIAFAFEPVISLRKKSIEVSSWEALARDPELKRAPYELFQAAELWGPEFTTEMDLYCLENAVKTYAELWKTERKYEPKADPLAVNVYPDTLFRKSYEKLLETLIEEFDVLGSDRLTLEISEKRPVAWLDRFEDKHIADPMGVYADRIQSLSRSLGVTFAIDDFGVGHASADRLARLELDHVKIDREILHHPHPEYTIRYVLDIVQSSHKHPIKVVIEGFDGESRISLAEIYNDLKIKYVQGHMIRRASFTVADLDQDMKQYILSKLTKSEGYQEISDEKNDEMPQDAEESLNNN